MKHLALSLLAGSIALCSCADDAPKRLFQTRGLAPSLPEADLAALEHMGSKVVDDGVNFAVFSAHAERIDLLLFDDPDSAQPTRQFEMKRFGDVWSLFVSGLGEGQHYGFIAWGPNWRYSDEWFPGAIHGFIADVDSEGHRFNPNKLLIDPYARAIHRDHDWSKGSTASGPARTESTFAAASKSIVTAPSDYPWGATEEAWRRERAEAPRGYEDLIVYEVHAKGFTADPASGVTHPGTWRGVAEKASYLSDLGITAVEFLPINEKPLDGGYWGYQSLLFFSPELTYAAATNPVEALDEFREMVEALHAEGIEVIIDIVLNHTGEGGLWREKLEESDVQLDSATPQQLSNFDPKEVAGLYSFRGLDNVSYYALSPDDPGFYMNNTGVGNMTRCNNPPFRRLIMDSLRFWVEEMHVDGFRFDLAPILGEKDGVYDGTWPSVDETVLQEIVDDPVLSSFSTRMIAEPWSLVGFYLSGFPRAQSPADGSVGWYEWNANFRDWWRSFLNSDGQGLNVGEGPIDGGAAMTGSFAHFSKNDRRPYHSVNFITAHDGFTLYDLFSYEEKRNGCGPLNPACCDQPFSPFCDKNSGEDHNRSRNWQTCDCAAAPHCCGEGQCGVGYDTGLCASEGEAAKRQMMRNAFVGLFLSHGTPMMLGGDEWMRTQLGNNNAYSTLADNSFNWFQWGTYLASDKHKRMHDFVRDLISFRKEHSYAFAPAAYDGTAPFAWKSPDNTDAVDWNGRQVMIHYYDPDVGPELAVLINLAPDWRDFALPEGRNWVRRIDTQSYFDSADYLDEVGNPVAESSNIVGVDAPTVLTAAYGVAPRSMVVLEAR